MVHIQRIALREMEVDHLSAKRRRICDEIGIARKRKYGGKRAQKRREGGKFIGVQMDFLRRPIIGEFDRLRHFILEDFCFQVEKRFPLLNYLREVLRPKRSPRRNKGNRLEEICLPLRIIAKNDIQLRTKNDARFFVIAKIAKIEVFKKQLQPLCEILPFHLNASA